MHGGTHDAMHDAMHVAMHDAMHDAMHAVIHCVMHYAMHYVMQEHARYLGLPRPVTPEELGCSGLEGSGGLLAMLQGMGETLQAASMECTMSCTMECTV